MLFPCFSFDFDLCNFFQGTFIGKYPHHQNLKWPCVHPGMLRTSQDCCDTRGTRSLNTKYPGILRTSRDCPDTRGAHGSLDP